MSIARERHDLRLQREARQMEFERLCRRAIRIGLPRRTVERVFELSPTAFERMAAQERRA